MPYDPGAAARQFLGRQADKETKRRLIAIGADPKTLRAVEDVDEPDEIEKRARQIVAENQRRKRANGW